MGRPATSEVIKIRRQMATLSDEEFEEIAEQIEIIRELREAEKKRKPRGMADPIEVPRTAS